MSQPSVKHHCYECGRSFPPDAPSPAPFAEAVILKIMEDASGIKHSGLLERLAHAVAVHLPQPTLTVEEAVEIAAIKIAKPISADDFNNSPMRKLYRELATDAIQALRNAGIQFRSE